MGMAASQARFLQLTARKTNLEYMGQQINQERLALANESAGLFERQLTMDPPTPPSSLDDKYYTPGYTFTDPADGIQKKIILADGGTDGGVITYNKYLPDGTYSTETIIFDGTDVTADTGAQDTGENGSVTTVTKTIDGITYSSNINATTYTLEDVDYDDTTGRLTDFVYNGTTYASDDITYSPEFDEDEFNDDMNEYEYKKATYDYEIERINLETERIQKQDKSLELKMKQIDTEHKAISTEIDAVQKVIQKGIDSTFKTFS